MSSPLDEFDDSVEDALVPVDYAETDIEFYAPLTQEEAVALTETIRSAVDVLWVLISRAHAGRAWEALGYGTWADYVREEFNMSRSRSYQLLDQGRVVHEIESAVPEGTKITITEAAARDLKGVLEEVIPEIANRTSGLDPEDATDVLDEILNEKRERMKEERDAAYADADLDDEYFEDLENGYYGDRTGGGNHSGEGGGGAFTDEERPAPVYDDINDVDVVAIRRAVNAAHELYSSLSALAGLPSDLEDVVDIIPKERYAQIDDNLEHAIENLTKFSELWTLRRSDEELDEDLLEDM